MQSASEIRRKTGGYLNALGLMRVTAVAGAYQELLAKVQALPFVPAGWLSDVNAAMRDGGPDATWMPAPAVVIDAWRNGKNAPLYPDTPSWISTPEQAGAWNSLNDWWAEKLSPILAGWGQNQKTILDAANNDAAFWNTLYTVVKPIAVVGEAIIAAPQKVGETASRMVLGALKGLAPVLLIAAAVGVGFLVYKSGAYKKVLGK